MLEEPSAPSYQEDREAAVSSEVFVPTSQIPLCQPTRLDSQYIEVMLTL